MEFSLVVDDKQEHLYREAQRVVNRAFENCKAAYPNRPIEEIWGLVSLRIALNYRQVVEHADLNPVLDKIDEINRQIENVLTNDEGQTSK